MPCFFRQHGQSTHESAANAKNVDMHIESCRRIFGILPDARVMEMMIRRRFCTQLTRGSILCQRYLPHPGLASHEYQLSE
jgi:hypothetical protein